MLRRLWRYRLLTALVVLVAVVVSVLVSYDVSGSGLKKRTKQVQFGAAQNQFYVDTRRPSLVTSQALAADLVARARVLASFVNSGRIKGALATALHVPPAAISVQSPTSSQNAAAGLEPVAQQRANQLLSEGSPYSVVVNVDASSPLITLFTQAPTAAEAIELAAEVPRALSAYLADLTAGALPAERARIAIPRELEATRTERRIGRVRAEQKLSDVVAGQSVVRSLGRPVGGPVTSQSGRAIGVLVFVVVLLLGWLLIVLLAAVLDQRRART